MKVSRQQLPRALRVAHALLTEAERRGYTVTNVDKSYNHRAGIGLVNDDSIDPIELVELTDQATLTPEETARWEREHRLELKWYPHKKAPTTRPVANGYLKIASPTFLSGRRSSWSEGPRGPMDRKLVAVFDELAERTVEYERLAEERAIRAKDEAEAAEHRMVELRARQKEEARRDRLEQELAHWRLARDSRLYVAEMRDLLADLPPGERTRAAAWCTWIEEFATSVDPLAASGQVGTD